MISRILPSLNAKPLLNLAWVVVIGVLLLLAADAFIGKPGLDSSTYIYVAEGILKGELPYVDRWDNKGPLLYSLNAIALLIHETWGLWVVESLFLLSAAAFAFLTLKKRFGLLPAAFALALVFALYARFAAPGNYTEQYGLLFQFLALYLFLRSQDQSEPAPSHVRFAFLHLAIGALGAASFLLRPNLVGPLARHRSLLDRQARLLSAEAGMGRCRRWQHPASRRGILCGDRGLERALECCLCGQLLL